MVRLESDGYSDDFMDNEDEDGEGGEPMGSTLN